jgi:hypothetical protein
MYRAKLLRRALVPVCLVVAIPDAGAGSLVRSLLATEGRFVVTAPFVDELERTVSRSIDYFATASSPGFTYRYDPELDIYERSSISLGPAFLQRADTVGKGRFDAGVTYLYADFVELDGDDLDGLERGALFDFVGVLDGTSIRFDDFDLVTNAVYVSGTYGITDRIDASVLLPVFFNQADTHQERRSLTFGTQRLDTSDDAAGIGDVQARAKWRFLDGPALKAAAGLAVRAPTGREEDFQGIGDVTVTPAFVLSRSFGRYEAHASLGMEVNADDLDRTRGTYGAGMSVGVLEWLTGNLDVIGTSQISDEQLTSFVAGESVADVQAAAGDVFRHEDVTFKGVSGGTRVITTLDRQDVVDLAAGVKVQPFSRAVVSATVIVPLTTDGVRADVVPAVGIEFGF